MDIDDNRNSNQIVDQLKRLSEKMHDAENGFIIAAEHVNSENLKSYFLEKSKRSKEFALALNSEINKKEEVATDDGSILGKIHQSWMNINGILQSDSEDFMLKEVIRGERKCLIEYDEVLISTELSVRLRDLLNYQKDVIENGYGTMIKWNN